MNLTFPGSKDYENMGKISGPIVGRTIFENGTGLFGMADEQKSEAVCKGGRKSFENRTGLFGMTDEQKSKAAHKGGHKGGHKTFENKTGIFSMTAEEKFEAGRKGGRNSGHEDKVRAARLGGRKIAERLSKEGMAALGRKATCLRWNINRGKPCVCGMHEQQMQKAA
jgi:hypothetical protein